MYKSNLADTHIFSQEEKMSYIWHYDSPVGKITMAENKDMLTGLWFNGQKYFADRISKSSEEKKIPVFEETEKWLDIYFGGREPGFIPPIDMEGISPFRKRVWEIMLTIPYGKTRSYGSIAKQISSETGKRASAQAVGGAVGHNSISIIIPCHRVVGENGNLTGYAGGIDKKIMLLKIENADFEKLFIPQKKSFGKDQT